MTIFDAIKSNPTFINVPDALVEAVCINRGVESTDEYTTGQLQQMELVTADLYLEILTMPNIKEGQLNIQYDKATLRQRARNIYLKYSDDKLADTGPSKIDLSINVQ